MGLADIDPIHLRSPIVTDISSAAAPAAPVCSSALACASATGAPDPEAEFVARLKLGDPEAFETLVREHGPRMLALARRYLPRETDAEDALQDAFMSVFRFVGSFAGGSRLTTWLHRITVNAALMRIRARSRRHKTLPEDAQVEVTLAETVEGADPAFTASDLLSREETRDVVRRCLDRLEEDCRIVVRLRDIEGLDLREIGRLLGVGVSTVKSRLRRGRLTLRALLESHLGSTPR